MKMKLALILVAGALGAVAIGQQPSRLAQSNENRKSSDALTASPPVLRNCVVSLINEAQVPAQEAGRLVVLDAVEGQQVKLGQLLGRIDDTQPRMQGLMAMEEHEAAKEKANNAVDVEYAEKATQLAHTEWKKSMAANERNAGAISDIEVMRQWLTYERGGLEQERAVSERKIAAFTAAAKSFEIALLKDAVKRREILSPVEGEVVQVHLHKGEWVKPGDPVLHVVQLDRLKVEGFIDIAQFSASQIVNRPVTIEATLQGRKVEFNGRITFASPLVEGTDVARLGYRIKAEVDNREEDGNWLLLPGLMVDMRIHAREARVTKAE